MEKEYRSVQEKGKKLRKKIEKKQKKLNQVRNARLWTTLIFLFLAVLCFLNPSWGVELYLLIVYLIIFSFLFIKTHAIASFLKKMSFMEEFYKRQSCRAEGLPTSNNIKDTADDLHTHEDSSAQRTDDLNIFGSFSVFNLFDETFSWEGKNQLHRLLEQPESFQDSLKQRQQKIELMGKSRWLWQRFLFEGGKSGERISYKKLVSFLKQEKTISNTAYVLLLVSLWLMWLVGSAVGFKFSGLLWGAYFVCAFFRIQDSAKIFARGESLLAQLRNLRSVFVWLEDKKNKKTLEKIEPLLLKAHWQKHLKKIQRYLSFLSIQANPIVMILINALLPWSAVFAFLLERQKAPLRESLEVALDKIAYLEALNSLALLWVYHTKVFPETSQKKEFYVEQIYHPLIDRKEVVKNSFDLSQEKVILLTGSNMAGKSTFLRTIGINQILYLAGAPVFASQMKAYPFPVLSCLQISDSVRDGLSYFHSEVIHLKKLLQKASEEPCLFLIDEIYRGTNNKERFQGSYALISLLSDSQSLGFVSTHDLELARLEKEKQSIVNYHFSDYFEKGEMRFSYQLQKGPCHSTNALKIMEINGLPT